MVSMGLLTCGIVSLSFWYFRDCAKDAEESGCLFEGLFLRFAGRGLESYDRERRKYPGMFPQKLYSSYITTDWYLNIL